MKTLFGMVSLVAILFGLAFHFDGSVREAVFYLAASPNEKKVIDAYQQGRDLFFSKWTGKATDIAYWGDDPYVSARHLKGDYWLASGRVSFVILGTPKREPWMCVFDRRTREIVLGSAGGETDAALDEIKRGELDRLIATSGESESQSAREPARVWSYLPAHGWVNHRADVSASQSAGMGGYWADPTPTPSFVHGMQGTALDQRPHR